MTWRSMIWPSLGCPSANLRSRRDHRSVRHPGGQADAKRHMSHNRPDRLDWLETRYVAGVAAQIECSGAGGSRPTGTVI